MNVQDIIKLQFMSHATTSSLNPISMMYQFLIMLFISMLDDITKALPKLCEEIKRVFKRRLEHQVHSSLTQLKSHEQLKDTAISLNTRHDVNGVVMSRKYEVDQNNNNTTNNTSNLQRTDEADSIVDAVIAYISRLHNIPTLKLINNGHFIISYKDKPIQIAHNVYVKIDTISVSDSGMVSFIKFTISSNALSASELTAFVKKVHQDYLQEMKNSLGNNIYFFDHKVRDGMNIPGMPMGTKDPEVLRNHKAMLINSSPKSLSFTMTPFYSNKTFNNIFGKQVRDIEHRVRFFIDNKDWYDQKGIPYQLGILLSGIPGAGKTSVIRAIANYTRRHIINVNFANITTATQLKNLFYSDKLHVYTDGSLTNSQAYFIPIDQRLYVLEEVDAIGDIVKQRVPGKDAAYQPINDEITLAEILTVLDGTMEAPGRIVIMTSNHPEVLDRALIRPGRIDLQVQFDNADALLIKEMYEAYLDKPFPTEIIPILPDKVLSPAEVSQVLFRHFNTPSKVEEIVHDIQCTAALKKPSPSPSSYTLPKPPSAAPEEQLVVPPKTTLKKIKDFVLQTTLEQEDQELPVSYGIKKQPHDLVEKASNVDKRPLFAGSQGLYPEAFPEDGIFGYEGAGGYALI